MCVCVLAVVFLGGFAEGGRLSVFILGGSVFEAKM